MAATFSKMPPRLILVAAGLLLTVLVVHLAGIGLLRYVVEKGLHPALPKGTYVGEVHLNLFSGALEVDGFELRDAGGVRMRFGELALQVSPWRLLTGSIHVREAVLRHGFVRVERRGDGGFDLGLPDFSNTGTADEDAPAVDLRLDDTAVERVMIEYRDGDISSFVYIDSLRVGAYSTTAVTQQIPVDWALHWDHRAMTGEVRVALSAADVAVTGAVRTGLLDLDRALRLARLSPTIGGQLAYQGEFGWSGETLTLAGDLRAPRLAHADDGREIRLSDVAFPGFSLDVVTGPRLQITFRSRPGSRIASWQTAVAGQTAAGTALSLAGELHYSAGGPVDLRDLAVAADSIAWRGAGRRVRLSGLALDGRVQQRLSTGTPFPVLNASLAARALDYGDEAAALAVSLGGLRLDGLAISSPDGGDSRLTGRVALRSSQVTQAETTLNVDGVDATLGGRLGGPAVDLTGDATLSGIRVRHPLLGHGPLQLRRVAVSGLALGGGETAFDGLRLDGLVLPGEPDDTTLRVASVRVGPSRYAAAQGVSAGDIVIDGLQTAVIRDKAGQWHYPMSPSGNAGGADPVAADRPGGDGAPPAWRVAGLRVGGDSYLETADHQNPDMIAPRFRIDRLQIGALASDAPGTLTPFELTLRPDKYSEFVISGQMRPLAGEPFLEAEGHLHGFAMQAFNGLIANGLGHRFVEGQLDNDFRIRIDDDRLEMRNALALSKVHAEEIAGREGPPLTTAIALLEDRDGNIKLEVPVEGNLSDPDFRVLGALNPIIMKAVAGTAALAIQPLGSVLLVGSLLADQALKVTFQPALFDPRSTGLNPAAEMYLGKLAEKLRDKPKLAVRVCGVAVDAERRRDDKGKDVDDAEALLAMAQRRADAARAYLADKGAGAGQLRRCRPAIDPATDGRPRVDIRF